MNDLSPSDRDAPKKGGSFHLGLLLGGVLGMVPLAAGLLTGDIEQPKWLADNSPFTVERQDLMDRQKAATMVVDSLQSCRVAQTGQWCRNPRDHRAWLMGGVDMDGWIKGGNGFIQPYGMPPCTPTKTRIYYGENPDCKVTAPKPVHCFMGDGKPFDVTPPMTCEDKMIADIEAEFEAKRVAELPRVIAMIEARCGKIVNGHVPTPPKPKTGGIPNCGPHLDDLIVDHRPPQWSGKGTK